MRGSANETVVLSSLGSMEWVHSVYNCGMLAEKGNTLCACSPDTIAFLRYPNPDFTWGKVIAADTGGNSWPISFVEIKTAVSRGTLDPLLVYISVQFKMIHLASPDMPSYMPKEHAIQLSQQMEICCVTLGVYVCTSESGVLFTLLVYCDPYRIHIINPCLDDLAVTYVQWAHCPSPTIPIFTSAEDLQTLESKLPFWWNINRHVMETGPLHPVRTFRHGLQATYSRTKVCVDAAAQFLARLKHAGFDGRI